MKTKLILLAVSIMCTTWMLRADETITVTATSTDISENLDLKTVAMLFGEAKDLEQFEVMLNNPDSAYSNLDLNGDGEVDYLRVIETADGNKRLVVIQAVLAKDIYQDVASIYLEKDEKKQSVTIQVVGDEYIYGTNYVIEPVYIYQPVIYDWFWGPSWVCWHSPYYWGYYPHWWRPYHCIDPFLYWDHCYWHHYHRPICSYRHVHHVHHHHRHMHQSVRRNDYGHRHPERSFASRNASRNITNARTFDQSRTATMRQAQAGSRTNTRVSGTATGTVTRQSGNINRTYGSSNVRGAATTTTTRGTSATRSTTVRTSTSNTSRGSATRTPATTVSTTRSTTPSVTRTSTPSTVRSSSTGSTTRSTSGTVRTSSTGSTTRSTSSTVRSSGGSTMRSSGGSTMRSSGGSTMRTGSSGGSRTR